MHGPDYCPPQDETEIDWKARYEALEEAAREVVKWRHSCERQGLNESQRQRSGECEACKSIQRLIEVLERE